MAAGKTAVTIMDDKTTPTCDWLAFTLAFDASARLIQHLRQASPDAAQSGALITQFRRGQSTALADALEDQLKGATLDSLLCDSLEQRIDQALEWEQADKNHHLLALDNPLYPSALLDTADAPPLLYAKGDLDALNVAALAVVGSRKASRQSIDLTHSLSARMAERGVAIVSGLARGIDAAAHEGALSVAGRTIAVAATEPESVYPRQHRQMAQRIVDKGGLILTEYPLGAKTLRWYFPRRNRIISGLSLGVLVVEAGLPSGTLTTATHAINQGREVMAVPGSVYNLQARGCHYLIKQGATLVESEQDILDALAWPLLRELTDNPGQNPSESGMTDASANTNGADVTLVNRILTALAVEPASSNELLDLTGCSTAHLDAILGIMEIEGRIKACSGGRYTRC